MAVGSIYGEVTILNPLPDPKSEECLKILYLDINLNDERDSEIKML
jgi:hypothetical protein